MGFEIVRGELNNLRSARPVNRITVTFLFFYVLLISSVFTLVSFFFWWNCLVADDTGAWCWNSGFLASFFFHCFNFLFYTNDPGYIIRE